MNLPEGIVIEETIKAGEYRQRRQRLTEVWANRGEILPELHTAALHFESDFDRANHRAEYRSCLNISERVDGGGKRDSVLDAVIDGRRAIGRAMDAVGRTGGSVLWDVIGNEMSLREYASRMACNGVALNVHNVKGRLIAALDVLVGHYKLN